MSDPKTTEHTVYLPAEPDDQLKTLTFLYTNYRGETECRRAKVIGIEFTSTQWHPEPQWFMHAYDMDRNADLDFAMRDMKNVRYDE